MAPLLHMSVSDVIVGCCHVVVTASNHASSVTESSHSDALQDRFLILSISAKLRPPPLSGVYQGPRCRAVNLSEYSTTQTMPSSLTHPTRPTPSTTEEKHKFSVLQHDSNESVHSYSPFSNVGSIRTMHCEMPCFHKGENICKLLFYTQCLWNRLQIEDTSNTGAQDTLISA